jgi:hypothetical protein
VQDGALTTGEGVTIGIARRLAAWGHHLGGAQPPEGDGRLMGAPASDPAGVFISSAQMYQEPEIPERWPDPGRDQARRHRAGHERLGKDVADHETRIRTLEKARWPLPTLGVLAGLAGAATGAVALFAR